MAAAYGLDYLVVGPAARLDDDRRDGARHPGAPRRGRRPGAVAGGDVDRHAAGLRRTLAALGLRDGSGDPPAPSQRRLGADVWLRSTATGFWHPSVVVGDAVHAGDRVGEVQDAFGTALEVVTASVDGVVLFLVTSLAMNAGDPLLALGA